MGDIKVALNEVADFYNINLPDLVKYCNSFLEVECKASITNSKREIILPFCGKIYENRCRGIIYNHGLYTQCNRVMTTGICNGCSKLKYGIIEDRLRVSIKDYVTPSGKKPIPYENLC